MIEAVRISRAAYPNRLRHEYFMQRFCMLAPDESDVPSLLAKLLPEGGYCIGKTKIFFKPRIMPMLESRRTALCSMLATRLQVSMIDALSYVASWADHSLCILSCMVSTLSGYITLFCLS